jgi:glycogen(starch) synthase
LGLLAVNVLLCGESSGGAFTFLRTLARELDRRGCQVTLALMGQTRPRPIGAESIEVLWRPGRLEWMRTPWGDVDAAGDWLLEIAARRQPAVVHLSGYAHASLPFGAPVLLTAQSDLVTWSHAVHGAEPPPDFAEYGRRVRAALAGEALLVAPTAAHLRAMEQVYGPLPKARVIFSGSRPWPQREPKQRWVLAAGRVWDEGKNTRALSGAQLPRGWGLAVAGPRRHPDGGSASLPGARLLGDLDEPELRGWLARAAVFVDPAVYEPFGLSALEAAQAGCALVLADIPTLRELWSGAALFADPHDRGALQTALWLAATSEALRQELARGAALRAERYTAAAMADAYLATYLELANRRSLPRAS